MMQAILKRIFHFQEMILLLSLATAACVPIALSNLVRDASLSLLLPTTLLGMLLAWALAKGKVRKSTTGIILLFLGPLALFIRIGQMGGSIFELIKQAFRLTPALYHWLRFETPLDPSLLVIATNDLALKVLALGGRLGLWVAGFFSKTRVEDPVTRTLIWTVGLWLVAVWAGWQIFRNKRLLLGILPSTILLALVLDYTGREVDILWYHLAMLFFLIGLYSYANTQRHWQDSNIDYSESTGLDTLILVSVLSSILVFFAFLGSTISIKDILEDMRERRTASSEARAETIGLQPAKDEHTVASSFGGLPRSHLIGAGPELSEQLVMSISTGDLPPMSLNSQAIVPRYYWRTHTYQIYTSAGWANPSTTSDDINADQSLFETTEENIRIVNQQVTFPIESGQLFWTGTLLRADVPFKAVWNRKVESAPQANPRFDTDLLAALAPVESYRAESMLLKIQADELRNSPSVYPAWVQKQFLQLPESVPERVLGLARDLTASESNPYDRALAIQNYLREFPYTLEVGAPPAGRDVADYFLFDLKQGYCDYYATTMVVLARAAGLPARLVIGYANGTYDHERAEYIVTENYAHSWVEVYFANIGWVEFEPTASEPVIPYGEFGNAPALEQPLPQKQPFDKQVGLFFQRMLAGIWMPLGFVAALAVMWIAWDTLRITWLEPARAIQLLFKRLRRLARPLSGIASLDQTVYQYSRHLMEQVSSLKVPPRIQHTLQPAMDEIHQLTELYSRSLFSPFSPSQAETRGAIKTWLHLRWRLTLANLLMLISKISKRF